MLVLPEFGLLHRQPKVPHVALVILRRDIPNEYGVPITYTIKQSRNGTVRVGEKKSKAQIDRELDEALAKLKEKRRGRTG
jgi:hypothetical protein